MKKLLLTLIVIPFMGVMQVNAQGGCQASFQYSAANCPQLNFYDATMTDSMDQVVSWAWNFGDGNFSNSAAPSNTYAANGMYAVCLTIQTFSGCTSSYCDSVVVNCGAQGGCQAAFQLDSAICPDVAFYDVSTSNMPIIGWLYYFGDGTTSTSPNPTHTFTANGYYSVCLEIVTSDSCTSMFCDTVIVDCIAGLNESSLNTLTVSPNPAHDLLQLNLEQAQAIEFTLVDLKGAIHSKGIKHSAATHTFDLNGLDQGMYLLIVEIEGVREVIRFIKE